MAHAAFSDAVELLDWLEVESISSVGMKDKTQILKLELRFLSTFLKYTVNRCTEYEDLQHLFTRIGDVGENINKLASSSRKREVDGAIRDLLEKIRLIRPQISEVQIKVSRSYGSGSSMSDELVVNFVDSLELANPNTKEVQMEVYGASGSGTFIRNEIVVEFIATLQEDLEELLACEVNLLQPSLKEGIKILKRKLIFLKGLFGFTATRCCEHDKLNQLFLHVQAMADNAAYLAYSCLMNGMDEDMGCILALELSDLVQKIDPIKPEVREIYIGVVKSSKSSESKSNTYERVETAVDFVDSLLQNTTELLLYRDIMPVKDQIEVLHVELTSLKYFLKDADSTRLGNLNYLLAHAEDMALDSGPMIYSLFEGEPEEMSLALSGLLDKFKLGRGLLRMIYFSVERANISNFPRTDELGALDLFLQNLKELINDRADSITLLRDHIQIVQRDMEFLRFFMSIITKQHREHENPEDLWNRIKHVMYEIEYVIDSVMVKDGPILHHILWLSDLIEEIKLIKKEINELPISDKYIHGLQEDDVTKISSGFDSSQFHASRIDEEMVDFEDEEKEVVLQLVGESKQLEIVSIVGMSGVGRTFLAQEVYEHPAITNHFYVRAWCCVSEEYEKKELLINILRQVKKFTEEMSEKTEYELAEMLHKCLKGQRYLIVLDDMWDIEAWDALNRSFPDDRNGSRIVFTSRFSNLASQANRIHELLISDNNIHVAKISSGFELSQFNAPRIDEEMVGFEDEEQKVVEELVGGSRKLQLVSIVGRPGLGKTFLAQKVYNNPVIKGYFHVRAWCTVSQVYERKELLINILSQVKRSTVEMSEKTDVDLADELRKCLKGQKYLIVLDDIWDIGAWNALKQSFPDDHYGSRILFTSRSSRLAVDVNPSSILHHLRSFSDEGSWELLQNKIFQKKSCPLELRDVGWEIAKRCNGLPLAVVVVAGLLARIGNEKERWRRVAKSLNSNIIDDRERWSMDILDLTYKYLPEHLKPCFLYFAGFSEDKQIPVVKLTRLWIAEGFVRGNQTNLETIAEGYLMDLIDRSLIIASERRSTGGVKACIIHDLIRDFCLSKAEEENFLKVIDGCGDLHTSLTSSKAIIPSIPSSYSTSHEQRRLFVHHRQNTKFWSKSSGPCVRSLLFFSRGRKLLRPDEVSSIFQGFKLLKVLDMMHIDVGATFPEGLELLALLRYLAVSGKFSSIPPSITNLQKLESFLVRAVSLLSLRRDILNLSKLRHLHINGSMSLVQLSSEDPSQLDCLQTLSKPILSYGDSMNKMRRFPNLKKLSCVFEESWDFSTECNRLPILDFLKQLESLKVSYHGQMRHPCEFSLPSNIKKLTMSGFRLPWEQISIVGQLPHLVVLKLLDEAFQGEEWILQDGEFLKLKFLKLEEMNIREWIASEDSFPCLERLTLEGCRQLEEIPSCLGDIATLEMILVEECSESLVNAVRRIQEEQLDMGNEEFKIEIKHRSD